MGVAYLPNEFCTPHIGKIYLLSWMIPATAPSLGSLSELTLEELDRHDGPNFHQVFDVLQKAPCLEHLILRNAFRDDSVRTPDDILHLPSLQSLEIQCKSFGSVLITYSNIHHPSTTRVRLGTQFNNLNGHPGTLDSLKGLGTFISSRADFRHASIAALATTIVPRAYYFHHGTITMPAHDWPQNVGPSTVNIKSFCEGLQLYQLKSLSVESLELPLKIWCSVFGVLQFLTTLCIHHSNRNLLCALAESLDNDGTIVPYSKGRMGFHALHTLVLQQWILDEDMVGLIESCLDIRSTKCPKLKTLRLVRVMWSKINPALAVEQLEMCAKQVEIDGIDFQDTDMEDSDDDSGSHSSGMETDTE
ncbi:hypothetical protein DXG01_002163 [Tephrocybe rancida]|nr:hypothetical protein DXG01_002163 [Tephrocybe rancida]